MSVSEQIKDLRLAAAYKEHSLKTLLNQAADTIEALSEKLAKANMERSESDCGGGWIPCSERLPENYQDVLVSGDGIVKQAQYIDNVFECEDPEIYFMLDDSKIIGCEDTTFMALAWRPLPEPYTENEKQVE